MSSSADNWSFESDARKRRFVHLLLPFNADVRRTGTMPGVEIHDKHPRGFLAFDLKEILRCLGHDAINRVWRCVNLECSGEAMQELEALEQTGAFVTGERLLALAERTNQVIWGDFLGRRPGEADSLRIRAIDSTWWEVCGDDACLGKVRAAFKNVRPAAAEAG